jgi:hypothetical protein
MCVCKTTTGCIVISTVQVHNGNNNSKENSPYASEMDTISLDQSTVDNQQLKLGDATFQMMMTQLFHSLTD